MEDGGFLLVSAVELLGRGADRTRRFDAVRFVVTRVFGAFLAVFIGEFGGIVRFWFCSNFGFDSSFLCLLFNLLVVALYTNHKTIVTFA